MQKQNQLLQKRLLHFPEDRSVGNLSTRLPGTSAWQKWKAAKGIVEIPAEVELALSVVREARTDLAPLAALQPNDLQALDLGWTRIGDADLHHFAHLHHLLELDLGFTKITDEGLRHLQPLRALKKWKVAHTRLSDDGMHIISRFDTLEQVSLRGTQITDESWPALAALSRLIHLDVRETGLSATGIEQLQLLLPACKILHDDHV